MVTCNPHRGLAVLLCVAACAACATLNPHPVTAEGSFRERGIADAALALKCPVEQLTFEVLWRNDGFGCAGSQLAVRGCGKQTTYLCDEDQEWGRDSQIIPMPAPAPTPVPTR